MITYTVSPQYGRMSNHYRVQFESSEVSSRGLLLPRSFLKRRLLTEMTSLEEYFDNELYDCSEGAE